MFHYIIFFISVFPDLYALGIITDVSTSVLLLLLHQDLIWHHHTTVDGTIVLGGTG